MKLEIRGEELELLPERALWWPRRGMLMIADLHAGKDAAFRAAAVPIPRKTFADDLERLSRALRITGARRLTVLGDLAHHRSGWTEAVQGALREWRASHRGLAITLLRGNHDDHAGDPPAELEIECRDGAWELEPFRLAHQPHGAADYTIAGHLHPSVTLRGKGIPSASLPCFYFGATHALLPAFGQFTGTARIRPKPGDRVFAIAGAEVIEIPTSALR
jgi:DNA ligase-associated metallophosphoesterase